jgi:hypothetical protein
MSEYNKTFLSFNTDTPKTSLVRFFLFFKNAFSLLVSCIASTAQSESYKTFSIAMTIVQNKLANVHR